MKISALDEQIKLIDGKPLANENNEKLTVRGAIRQALSALFKDEENLSFEKKMKRYEISKKIWNAEENEDFTIEELAEIKHCVGKFWFGEVLGYIIDTIEKK